MVERVPVPPAEVDVAVLAANVRHHLDRRCMRPSELFEPPASFRPLSDVDTTAVLEAISRQAGMHGFNRRYGVVEQWPEEARVLFYASELDASAGGNGLEVFFENQPGNAVMSVLDALTRLGAERLAVRFRQGLGLARDRGAPSIDEVDEDWLGDNAGDPPDTDADNPWHTIDSHEEDGTYALLRDELPARVIAFIAAHREALLA